MSIASPPRELGRYVVFDQIASGGMATVHLGRMHGAVGFARIVAIKRLHANYACDGHFVQMFLDEARLAARVKHPNVVATIDVVADEDQSEVFLVMEHVLGESLEALMLREGASIPISIISAIMCAMLEGLHAVHEAEGDTGEPLEIVHRDVSPHNILVGVDGTARVFDFGIAKAAINTQETRDGVVKGKVSYMAPEQVRGAVDRRADIYSAGVILWELLVGLRRHAGERNDQLFLKLATGELDPPTPPSMLRRDVPVEMDDIVARATALDPDHRFSSAREMALAMEAAMHPALARDVSEWVRHVAGERIARLSALIQRIEGDSQAPSGITLSLAPPYSSTSSIRAAASMSPPSSARIPVTGTITRTGGVVATRVSPMDFSPESHAGAPAAARRSWTMPAALVAFTAMMLLVGLRLLSRRETTPSDLHEAAAAQAPPELSAALEPAPARTGTTIRSGVKDAPDAGAASTAELMPLTRPPAPAPPPAIVAAPRYHWTPPAPVARPVARTPDAAPPAARPAARAPDVAPAAPAPPSSPPAAAAGPKAGCENPFAIGPDGIRQIKPECM